MSQIKLPNAKVGGVLPVRPAESALALCMWMSKLRCWPNFLTTRQGRYSVNLVGNVLRPNILMSKTLLSLLLSFNVGSTVCLLVAVVHRHVLEPVIVAHLFSATIMSCKNIIFFKCGRVFNYDSITLCASVSLSSSHTRVTWDKETGLYNNKSRVYFF